MEKGKMKLSRQYYERLENVFSIEYKDTAGTSNARVHRHDQYEILLCLSDGMFLTVDGEEHEIRKNTLLIFNSVDLHQCGTKEQEGENKRYVLYFDPSYVDYLSSERVSLLECFLFRPFPDGWILELTEAEADDFCRHLDRLLELRDKSEEECYGKELYIQLLLAEMLLKVNSLYRSYHGIANEDHDRNLFDNNIANAEFYIFIFSKKLIFTFKVLFFPFATTPAFRISSHVKPPSG